MPKGLKIIFISLIVLLLFPLIILVLLFIYTSVDAFFTNESKVMKLNWNINITEPKKSEIVYTYEYRKGAEFKIWTYKNKKAISNVNLLKLIDENNQEEAKKI